MPAKVKLKTSTLIDHISTAHIDNTEEAEVHKVLLSDRYTTLYIHKLNSTVSGVHKLAPEV